MYQKTRTQRDEGPRALQQPRQATRSDSSPTRESGQSYAGTFLPGVNRANRHETHQINSLRIQKLDLDDQIFQPGTIADYIKSNYSSPEKYEQFEAYEPPKGAPIIVTTQMLEEARKTTGKEKAKGMDQFPD